MLTFPLCTCICEQGKKLPDVAARGAASAEAEVSDEDEAAELEDEAVHAHVASTKSPTKKKLKLAQELSDCIVICQSASFTNFEESQRKSEHLRSCKFCD